MGLIDTILFVLLVIVFIYTLKVRTGAKRVDANYKNYYKKLLRIKTKVLDLEYKVKYLIIHSTEHKSSLDLLELQMNQVHDWLGRLTISGYMEELVTRTGEFPVDENQEEN